MTEKRLQTRIIGYARVSTYGQTLDAQLEQLKTAGCAKTYREQASGAKVERRELQRMLKDRETGDVVTGARATLSGHAQQRAGAAPRRGGSIWAVRPR